MNFVLLLQVLVRRSCQNWTACLLVFTKLEITPIHSDQKQNRYCLNSEQFCWVFKGSPKLYFNWINPIDKYRLHWCTQNIHCENSSRKQKTFCFKSKFLRCRNLEVRGSKPVGCNPCFVEHVLIKAIIWSRCTTTFISFTLKGSAVV